MRRTAGALAGAVWAAGGAAAKKSAATKSVAMIFMGLRGKDVRIVTGFAGARVSGIVLDCAPRIAYCRKLACGRYTCFFVTPASTSIHSRRRVAVTTTAPTSAESSTGSKPAEAARAEPVIITIFGATGDLTMRKLLPAIYNLTRDGLLHENTVVVGFARRPKTMTSFARDAGGREKVFAHQAGRSGHLGKGGEQAVLSPVDV